MRVPHIGVQGLFMASIDRTNDCFDEQVRLKKYERRENSSCHFDWGRGQTLTCAVALGVVAVSVCNTKNKKASQYRLPKQPHWWASKAAGICKSACMHESTRQAFVLSPYMLPVLSARFMSHLGRNIQELFYIFFGSLSQSSKFPLR